MVPDDPTWLDNLLGEIQCCATCLYGIDLSQSYVSLNLGVGPAYKGIDSVAYQAGQELPTKTLANQIRAHLA